MLYSVNASASIESLIEMDKQDPAWREHKHFKSKRKMNPMC